MLEVVAVMATILITFIISAFTTYEVYDNEMAEMATFKCGFTNSSQGLISNDSNRGEWPFLAAIFKLKEEEEKDFFCGGSLISPRHILTAAHCIEGKGIQEKLLPGHISVVLGAYNLTSKTEIGVQQRGVQEIYVHPEWDSWYFKSEQYDADLAILLLKKVVLFTDYIRPVCIPFDDTVIDGVKGTVVGWGLREMGTKPKMEFIEREYVTALNIYFCLITYPDVAALSSLRTFCGQGEDGNANGGDSGGGFFVQNEESVWMQRGIVSSLRTNSTGHANADLVVVYTNVAKFRNWIADTVRQSGASIDGAKTVVKLNLECEFGGTIGFGSYICFVNNLDIRRDNIAMASFSGSHKRRNSDSDVDVISFRNGTMFFIPSGIGRIFKNLKKMFIQKNHSTKCIKRSDFKSLKKLVILKIFENDITTLNHDTIRDLQQLEVFEISSNRIIEIEEGTFEANLKLQKVYLQRNRIEALPINLFQNNSVLEVVDLSNNSLKTINQSIFETNTKLKDVYLGGNNLEILSEKLFQNNSLLEIVDLANNSFKIIDKSTFATNIKLQRVFLNENNFTFFPSHLFEKKLLLEFVNLGNNPLGIIEESTFGTNIRLKSVFLYKNKLQSLPSYIFRNNSLLEFVSLDDNFLRIINEWTFEKNIKLKQVSLNGNQLVVLPPHLFRNNLFLEYIGVDNNCLQIIDEKTFETNINLQRVTLNYNKLEFLPKHLFQYNSLLDIIELKNNLLKIIETDFTSLKNIKVIYLYDNICIDAYYLLVGTLRVKNIILTDVQNKIRSNCSSSNS